MVSASAAPDGDLSCIGFLVRRSGSPAGAVAPGMTSMRPQLKTPGENRFSTSNFARWMNSEAPHRASARLTVACLYGVVLATGFLSATGARVRREGCRSVPIGRSDVVRGRFLATPRDGAAPFRLDSGCGVVTVVLPSPDAISGETAPDGAAPTAEPRAGRALEVRGIWRSGRVRPWLQARETRRGVDRATSSTLDTGYFQMYQ